MSCSLKVRANCRDVIACWSHEAKANFQGVTLFLRVEARVTCPDEAAFISNLEVNQRVEEDLLLVPLQRSNADKASELPNADRALERH
mmetsp:Transcript_52202/g.81460  ORF Transcript_52202/g.81460 Transcript_52202/m.81460 type:complete len:88 (+) Transcript_52202:1473-1736(+)